jgi:putative chitinase
MISAEALKLICPNADDKIVASIVDHAADVFAKRNIQSGEEACQLIAQICVETWGLTRFEENLNYSGSRLWQVFGASHFKSEIDAAHVAADGPRAIANRVYGGRMGNSGPNDGWIFRARGPLGLTGHDQYAAMERATGLPLVANPDLALSEAHALDIACAYWTSRNIHEPARAGKTAEVTRLINGGSNGLSDRIMYLGRAHHYLDGAEPAPAPSPAPVAPQAPSAVTAPVAPSAGTLVQRLNVPAPAPVPAAQPVPVPLPAPPTTAADSDLIHETTRALLAAGHTLAEAFAAVVAMLTAARKAS